MFRHVRALVGALSVGLMILSSAGADQGQVGPAPSTLTVLYAGKPDSPRMKEFVALLEKHFAKVGTHDAETSFADAAKDYDVVVIDWPGVYPRTADGKMDMSSSELNLSMPTIAIDQQFSKPVVMIGVAGGIIINKLQTLALDWKCLCLENYAHDTDTSHPIFQGPLPVTLAWETIDKPSDYFLYPGAKKIDEQMQAWKVQRDSFPVVDPGLVSSRERLADYADAEAISGGVNGKGPTSVSIGRHGNFLLWGYSGAPSELTEPAQAAFINSICYMNAFDGQSPQHSNHYQGIDPRHNFLTSIYQLRLCSDEYVAACVKQMEKLSADTPMPPEIAAQIGDNPAQFFKQMGQQQTDRVLQSVPQEVREQMQNDSERIIAYYTDNFDYLHSSEGVYSVDEDAKAVGVSNRDLQFLDRCSQMLASEEQSKTAVELLDRYVEHSPQSAQQWSDWLKRTRDRISYKLATEKFVLND